MLPRPFADYIRLVVRQKRHDDILELLREEGAEAVRKAQRGLIIQPGAIGDCILTLPLAALMKETLGLGGIDMLGHAEYIEYLPGRSCVDRISSIDLVDIHRLFAERNEFDVIDRDPLISTFGGYAWIATFLGEPGSDFEHNLVYTANCSGACEIVTLPVKAPDGFDGHLTEFHARQFISQTGLAEQASEIPQNEKLLSVTQADAAQGKKLLKEAGIDSDRQCVVIHPGSGGLKKCWHLDNFLAVAQVLQLKGLQVLFLLGPAEFDRFSTAKIDRINNISRSLSSLSLTQVLALLSCADTFIGNDSGITHLAAGLGVPVFVLFGPTNPSLYGPIGPKVTVLSSCHKTFAKRPSVTLQRKLIEAVFS